MAAGRPGEEKYTVDFDLENSVSLIIGSELFMNGASTAR